MAERGEQTLQRLDAFLGCEAGEAARGEALPAVAASRRHPHARPRPPRDAEPGVPLGATPRGDAVEAGIGRRVVALAGAPSTPIAEEKQTKKSSASRARRLVQVDRAVDLRGQDAREALAIQIRQQPVVDESGGVDHARQAPRGSSAR